MTEPTDRDLEAALRASLEANARHAPPGDGLAEQIVATTGRRVVPAPHRAWGRFTLPAAAAILAAIVGIAAAFFVTGDGNREPPVAGTSPAMLPTSSPTPTVPVSPTSSPSEPSPLGTSNTQIDTSTLQDLRIVDLTFTATDHGWALASAQCIRSAGRCTALARTTDGRTWTSVTNPPVNVPGVNSCADPCATHIRFATDDIGYVYGPDVLYMTTDGGASWQAQDGGALALESANGNVVRLVRTVDGAQELTAPIGSSTWQQGRLAVQTDIAPGVQLARNGTDAYALIGTQVYRSADDGATWTKVPDPCANGNGPILALAAGGERRVALACTVGSSTVDAPRLVRSEDGGRTFAAQGALPARSGLLALGPRNTYLLAGDRLSRSTDEGARWRTIRGPAPQFVWLGFESDTVGRIVGHGGSAIWTTRDGGATWTKVVLP